MRLLFVGDIVGKPGREILGAGLAAIWSNANGIDFVIANVENSAGGFGVTREIAEDDPRLRRPRDDVRQSRLGQEGSARLHRAASRGCSGRSTIRPACRGRARRSSRARRTERRRRQRDGPRSSCRCSTIRSRSSTREIAAIRERDARRHRRLPRRGDVGEDRDGHGTSTAASTAVVGTHTHVADRRRTRPARAAPPASPTSG